MMLPFAVKQTKYILYDQQPWLFGMYSKDTSMFKKYLGLSFFEVMEFGFPRELHWEQIQYIQIC